jgi:hypothetical protein
MATTRKRSSATKKNKTPSSRKLALKKATLKDLTPQGRTAKGGALFTLSMPIKQSMTSVTAFCDPTSSK